MSDERTRRVGHNEALYRQVNERIEDLNASFGAITGAFEIVCECGDIECMQRITVPREVYERTRANPDYFIVVPGHEAPDLEEPIEGDGDYVIVEKEAGLPKRIAEETDPRA